MFGGARRSSSLHISSTAVWSDGLADNPRSSPATVRSNCVHGAESLKHDASSLLAMRDAAPRDTHLRLHRPHVLTRPCCLCGSLALPGPVGGR